MGRKYWILFRFPGYTRGPISLYIAAMFRKTNVESTVLSDVLDGSCHSFSETKKKRKKDLI